MENIILNFKKVGEIALTIVTISFIFCFVGYIYDFSYLRSLNISGIFLDFNYSRFVIDGILHVFPSIIYFLYFLCWYIIFKKVEECETILSKCNKEIIYLRSQKTENFAEEKINKIQDEVEKYTNLIKNFKSGLIYKKFFSKTILFSLFFLIVYIIIIFVFKMYNKNWFSLIYFIIQFLWVIASLIILNQTRKLIAEGKSKSLRQYFWNAGSIGALFTLFILVMPVLSGFVNGKANIEANNFLQVNVKTSEKIISSCGLIGFGNGTYIFRVNDRNLYIPTSEIKQIEGIK